MITLLRIIGRIAIHPLKYELMEMTLTDGTIFVGCAENDKAEKFWEIMRKKHEEHLKEENMGLTTI